MGRTQVAVGCAVGIPIGVGIIISLIFWVRLQRRFKKEMEDDKELEHAIYDESGFISFDNFDSLKHEQINESQRDLSRTSDTTNTTDQESITHPRRNQNSNVYIPAYRKRINSMQARSIRISSFNNNMSETNSSDLGPHNNNNNNNNNIHNNSSMTSLSELPPQHTYKQTSQLHSSVYDQMVPMVESLNNETYFTKPRDPSTNNMISTTTLQSSTENLHNSNSFLINGNSMDQHNKSQLKNLYHNSDLDLGSYYPRHPSSSATNGNNQGDISSNIIGNSTDYTNTYGSPSIASHMFSGRSNNTGSPRTRNLQNQNNNIFATPTTERSAFDFPSSIDNGSIEQRHTHHLHNRSRSQNNVDLNGVNSTTTGNLPYDQHSSDSDSNSTNENLQQPQNAYKLQNNYDVQNNNEIEEEDQYENEFTNYTENRRQFINSMRPH
ncbi:similar to Saccharomyces cerevisiae YIL158W AIM20 Putative protein of unknown function [Maudiozyma saulgeensis]|uniref:Suppressor of lethality of KEX2 GAS1 double null mutant protein 1 n=1 Tax=Maudiozyma saulgeensis TaxID=1789683 RepID=A0A1X7RA22_9SACH|nr:similar to Saccharomyces cerevisiae YIL158W AIM20 Putative protein of unknown function [Kazachstania saulgeensis]